MESDLLLIKARIPIIALHAGLFISRGFGAHPIRVIDSYEIIFVRTGKLEMFEEDREYTVEAGQALLLWPGLKHGGSAPYASDLSFFWVHFQVADAGPLAGNAEFPAAKLTTVWRPDVMTELFHRYLNDRESGYLNDFAYGLYVLQMLNELNPVRGKESRARANKFAELADRWIRANFNMPLSTSSVASALGCNADYLGRMFRGSYGKPLTEAIHDARVNHACGLLLNATDNVDEIARECGYTDPGYFRRVFARRKGVSPSVYRKMCGMMQINTE
jgi:AraC-like DNA-binding protein